MKHFVTLRPQPCRSSQILRTARLLPSSRLPHNPPNQLKQPRRNVYHEAMEAVKQTIAQNFGSDGAHKIVSEDQQFDLEQTPSLEGKVAVITGGSEGIGYGCSHTFLSKGISKLFILSVSKEVVDGAIDAVKQEMGEEVAKKVVWLECDLSDWQAVKKTADKITSSTDRLDILVNNAGRGIMTYQLTEYGVDRHVCAQGGLIGYFTDRTTDGSESYGPRHPHQPPPSPHEEDRIP